MIVCDCDCQHKDTCVSKTRTCSLCCGRGGELVRYGYPEISGEWIKCKNCDGTGMVPK